MSGRFSVRYGPDNKPNAFTLDQILHNLWSILYGQCSILFIQLKNLVHKQMGKPLKKSFSMEFFLRARQWRDVAEFERKELLKVRVYRSLRQVSAALLSVAVITVVFR